MQRSTNQQRFRNEELILNVSKAVNREKWDEDRYEAFLDELCGDREYQKEAIRTALRYLLGGEYRNLADLAEKNFDENPILAARYGSWAGMKRNLQLPEQLSASLDLATGVGKSYILYGLAAILLAEGTVDMVLVLCPSTTIELGLMDKFKELAGKADLCDVLPTDAKERVPDVINASQSIVPGSICIENYHAILKHVGSSIRDSLANKGTRVAILNDETHHVANESAAKTKKWKEFLQDPDFGFHYIIGVSGTCYVGNEYFSDVIYRYSLRQAMEENYVKKVEYIAEMLRTNDPDEKWQLIRNRHEDAKRRLKKRKLTPLTIIVTPTIVKCKDVADGLKAFLIEQTGLSPEDVNKKVLVVYNNAPDVLKLPYVDKVGNKVEWIVSVSMLNEGWDVKRVFQIVPHEERAFNSKLLIAQVLGRGLRIPDNWTGTQPEVTIFNHDAWAPRIRHLVNEILEIEKRLSSQIVDDYPYHFDIHNINYTLDPTSVIKTPMAGEYKIFEKGSVDLADDPITEDVKIEFERAVSGERYRWDTKLEHETYTPREVAIEMYNRLDELQDPDNPDIKLRTMYTDKLPIKKLEKIVKKSLSNLKVKKATESMKQTFLRSLNVLKRKGSGYARYTPIANMYFAINTEKRQPDSASAVELKHTKTIFYTDQTGSNLSDEQVEFFKEVTQPGSGFKCIKVDNRYDFKTPLNIAIADSDNEKRFINVLLQPENVTCYDAWIKSRAMRFYEIDYWWRKGTQTKPGKFSPDFFIKKGDLIIVVEVKGEEELSGPSEENRKKNEYALKHFDRLNDHLKKEGNNRFYKFNFLTESDFNKFFQRLREDKIVKFRSKLDVKLAEEES